MGMLLHTSKLNGNLTMNVKNTQSTDAQIFVTQPYLPPLVEFIPYLEGIWERKILTNNGPLHEELEAALCEYLGVKHISLFTNGTIALITALQALKVKGEVITTPYTFAATAHSLLWNDITPVFVDIDPVTCNIDPHKIEEAITPNTTAIMPVHCYGTPCDVDAIQRIAEDYSLKVIYDAAHAFGVKDSKNESILNYGDLSILSFHATKIFNTFEGGAIVCRDEKTKKYIDNLKNFGITNETTIVAPGINGKMSEINSAMGLLQLKHMSHVLERRHFLTERYIKALSHIEGITLLKWNNLDYQSNYSYFPIIVDVNYPITRDKLFEKLGTNGIRGRRYFYPLVSEHSMYRHMTSANTQNLKNAYEISRRVICLPLYPSLSEIEQDRIISIIQFCNEKNYAVNIENESNLKNSYLNQALKTEVCVGF
jgi:dTDP-4-amino-4,6-dideoxygalactose transaminase